MTTETRSANDRLADVLEELARGKVKHKRTDWTKYRAEPPDKVSPGYAVISDPNGYGAQVIECYLIMEGSRGALCNPHEGRLRGPVPLGSLSRQVRSRELFVVQYAPYPQTRDDGQPFLTGSASYPDIRGFDFYDGVYYNKASALAANMLTRAKEADAKSKKAKAEVS